MRLAVVFLKLAFGAALRCFHRRRVHSAKKRKLSPGCINNSLQPARAHQDGLIYSDTGALARPSPIRPFRGSACSTHAMGKILRRRAHTADLYRSKQAEGMFHDGSSIASPDGLSLDNLPDSPQDCPATAALFYKPKKETAERSFNCPPYCPGFTCRLS